MQPRIKKLLDKNGITTTAYYTRISRGWDPEIAATRSCEKSRARYYVKHNNQSKAIVLKSTRAVAEYLTEKLRYTVTKNTVLGQIYRKGYATIADYRIEKKDIK